MHTHSHQAETHRRLHPSGPPTRSTVSPRLGAVSAPVVLTTNPWARPRYAQCRFRARSGEAADDHVVRFAGRLVDESLAIDGEAVPQVELERSVTGAGPHQRC